MTEQVDVSEQLQEASRCLSALIAATSLSPGPGLSMVTSMLASMLATALAYELNDLKRAQRQAELEQRLPGMIEQARTFALRFEAAAAGPLN
jgi:hypothetical protein